MKGEVTERVELLFCMKEGEVEGGTSVQRTPEDQYEEHVVRLNTQLIQRKEVFDGSDSINKYRHTLE